MSMAAPQEPLRRTIMKPLASRPRIVPTAPTALRACRPCRRWRGLLRLLAVALLGFASFAHAEEPPEVVGRIAAFQGEVSLLPAGTGNWIAAGLNRPLTIGDRLWVPPGGHADIVAGPDAIRLGSGTDLTLLDLREQDVQLSLSQGTLDLQVRAYEPGQRVEVDTPNLAFQLQSAGDVRLNVNPAADTTAATLRAGVGMAYGDNAAPYALEPGQRVQFAGQSLTVVAAEANPPDDAFDRWVAALNARENDSLSARYVSPWVTGYQGLDAWGAWSESPQYGAIWYPRVAPGWAPYRFGHWAWVAPWGWTWIAAEPWGFAPFHYGRWAWVNSAWAWVPGPAVVRPVYAPALVGFVGVAPGVTFSFGVAGGAAAVGWFPLGPGQIYRPAYAYTPAYLVAVNRCTPIREHEHDGFNVRREIDPRQLPPHAFTMVPRAAFVQGLPVQDHVHRDFNLPARPLPLATAPDARPLPLSVIAGARPMPWPTGFHPRPVLATRNPQAQAPRPSQFQPGNLQAQGENRDLHPNARQPLPLRLVPVPVRGTFSAQPEALSAQGLSMRPRPELRPHGAPRAAQPLSFEPSPALDAQRRLPPAPPAAHGLPPSPSPTPGFEPRPQPQRFAPPQAGERPDQHFNVAPALRPKRRPEPYRAQPPHERPMPEIRRDDRSLRLRPDIGPAPRGDVGHADRAGHAVPARQEHDHRAPEHGKPQGVPGPLQRAGMAPP